MKGNHSFDSCQRCGGGEKKSESGTLNWNNYDEHVFQEGHVPDPQVNLLPEEYRRFESSFIPPPCIRKDLSKEETD